MTRISFNVIAILFFCGQVAMSAPVELDPAAAESLLLMRPEPVYSELAQRARIQGTVRLLILVSENGSVTDVRVLIGHPLLDQGAVTSVWQSKYKPYAPQGAAIPFITQVEITFLSGVSGKDYARDLKMTVPYFEQEVKCRNLINAAKWGEAAETCSANLAMADKLGRHRVIAKMRAYHLAALAMLGQDKYQEVLEYLNRAYSIGKTSLDDDDIDVGEVLVTLGLTYSKMGKPGKARSYFAKGEKALQLACGKNQFLRVRYLPRLKQAMEYHIAAAEADGAAKEVTALKTRLAGLP